MAVTTLLPILATSRNFELTVVKSRWVMPQLSCYTAFLTLFDRSVDDLPPFLTSLTFGFYFDCEVANLPIMLKRLTFGHHFNRYVVAQRVFWV